MNENKLSNKSIKQKLAEIFKIIIGAYVLVVVAGVLGLTVFGANPTGRIIALVALLVISVLNILTVSKTVGKVVISLVQPIRELEETAKKMSEGDFSAEITYQSEDELGALADRFRYTNQSVKMIIDDLYNVLTELAEGNFNARSECRERYVGDFAPLLVQPCSSNEH